jgi:hypothetical protein
MASATFRRRPVARRLPLQLRQEPLAMREPTEAMRLAPIALYEAMPEEDVVRTRKCDVASIASAEGEVVWGVVYRIDDADRCALDAFEGFNPQRDPARNAYEAIKVVVLVQGNPAQPLTC